MVKNYNDLVDHVSHLIHIDVDDYEGIVRIECVDCEETLFEYDADEHEDQFNIVAPHVDCEDISCTEYGQNCEVVIECDECGKILVSMEHE